VIIEREKIVHSDIDPVAFERPLSRTYWLSKKWSLELPDSVRLSVEGLRAMNRILEPEEIEEASHAVLGFCDIATGVIHLSSPQMHKKQGEKFIAYADNIWDRALEARLIKRTRVHRQAGALSLLKLRRQSAESLLLDLEAMLKEQDEPDFLHRPTKYAYDFAEQLIKDSYTHYLGSAPIPAIGPDGEGGIVLEWKSAGRCVVRLIIPPSEDRKSYIYSRGLSRSEVDYSVSALALARQLCSTFAD
jgi:hypothetical protein